MKAIIFIYILISTILYANITLKDINSKPISLAKDFLIWQYLQQNITPQHAQDAFNQIQYINQKLLKLYAKKSDSKPLKFMIKCMVLTKKQLLTTTNIQCLKLAISPYKASFLTRRKKLQLIKNIDNNQTKAYLSLMNTKMTQKNLDDYSVSTILTVINHANAHFVNKYFNHQYTQKFIKKLMISNQFSLFVKKVVTNYKLDKLQASLFDINSQNLNAQTNFFLALNVLQYHKKQALVYLKIAYNKSKKSYMKDKVLFWKYLVTKDKRYLKILSVNSEINLYTLYAKQDLHVKVNNYFITVITSVTAKNKNLSNPFVWLKIKHKIAKTSKNNLFNLANSYKTKELKPVQAIIIAKACSYKIHNFIMPYNNLLTNLSINHKAFFYAIMRQESRFIPSSISTSYALGLMQMMPFVVKNLAKQLHFKLLSFNTLFNPKINILFAKKYLSWLQRHVGNALFQAYAYNGGYSFLKKYLSQNRFVDKKYEPFLSMELMANSQTRKYGKQVLTNYIIYQNIMGKKRSIIDFLNTLKHRNDMSSIALKALNVHHLHG